MIPHNRPFISKDDISKVVRILDSKKISDGSQVKNLEKRFSNFFLKGKSCALSSGTSALYLALKYLSKKKKLTVGLPTYACSALLNAVNFAGAKPVIFDINSETFNLDINKIDQKVDIIIVVHTFGSPASINNYYNFCNKIIEDCCHSIGGEYKGKKIGSSGDAAIFSFYATKIITSGQGGLIWSKNRDIINKAINFREFDLVKKYKPRFNLKLTDLQAGLVESQLNKIKIIKEKRNKIYKRYLMECSKKFELQSGFDGKSTIPYRFIIKLPNKKSRNKLRSEFLKKNIISINPIEKFELLHRYLKLKPKKFEISEKLVDQNLSVPIYPDLKDREVEKVCEVIRKF